jgi:hypothetical protein
MKELFTSMHIYNTRNIKVKYFKQKENGYQIKIWLCTKVSKIPDMKKFLFFHTGVGQYIFPQHEQFTRHRPDSAHGQHPDYITICTIERQLGRWGTSGAMVHLSPLTDQNHLGSFIEISFTWHMACWFKVYDSVVFSLLTDTYNHHYNQFLEHFLTSKSNPVPLNFYPQH